MSWGGSEFQDETTLDNHFTSNHGISFFAASGDSGAGVSWPAVSPNVIAVGGTSLAGATESAWNGSGGGISHFEQQPLYQKTYNISKALNMRAIPDVSYNADPKSGYAVFRSTTGTKGKWYVIGGTSAGTPQWAAIHALGLSASNTNFYKDKSSENSSTFFRDIVSGNNGDCAYYCQARARYDYVTGLGSPMTIHF